MTNSSNINNSASNFPFVTPQAISDLTSIQAFNSLFNNNQNEIKKAATQLKINWQKWAVAFDAQWFAPSEVNAKILTGRKMLQAGENAKQEIINILRQAMDGQQITTRFSPGSNPVNNIQSQEAFNAIFLSPEIADQQVEKLVTNWNKWALVCGGQWFQPGPFNAKIVAGRIIAKTIADAKNQIADNIKQAINGIEIKPNGSTSPSAPTGNVIVKQKLEQAKDRNKIYNDFYQTELSINANADNLAFLDRGIKQSFLKAKIPFYPEYFKQKPDNKTIVAPNYNTSFNPYPKLREIPPIDTKGLDFLHQDITEACVCIGNCVNGNMQARWLGKNGLKAGQFWSATKFIAALNVICQVNTKDFTCDIDNCVIRDKNRMQPEISFYDLLENIVSYDMGVDVSNSSAALLKRFASRKGLENWVKNITGNQNLEFLGDYGYPPLMTLPELYDKNKQTILLNGISENPPGGNNLSAYDLTRLISMLGWHNYLISEVKLPGAQWHSLETAIRAMGNDSSRYIDVALQKLGMDAVISNVAVISKLGFGMNANTGMFELTYVALVQFIDSLLVAEGKSAFLRSFALALRGMNKDAIQLDARIAAEVTEIVRRIITQTIA